MDILHAIILSIVEGVTEFLPISSTGHLILAARLLAVPQTDFVKSFEISIQLGAIAAVVFLYSRRLRNTALYKPLLAAFVPTAVVGFILYKFIKKMLLGNVTVTVAALLVGGVILLFFEKLHKEKPSDTEQVEAISTKQAIGIGLFQAISVVPGVSRAAATIVGGMLLGVARDTAVEFSFLLAVPTLAAATILDLVKSSASFTASEFGILAIGFLGALVTAVITIGFFVRFTQKHSLAFFGIYRILLAITFWFVIR